MELAAIKRKTLQDWQHAFPWLTMYGSGALYKIVGPMVVGIELEKYPRIPNYEVSFRWYGLWEKDVKTCLKECFMLTPLTASDGYQMYIPYDEKDDPDPNHVHFPEAVELVHHQLPVPVSGNVSLAKVLHLIDEYIGPAEDIRVSWLGARLQRARLCIALYTGNEQQIQTVLSQIRNTRWDREHFAAYDTVVEDWLSELEQTAQQPAALLTKIDANRQDKKFSNWQRSELV